MLALMLLVVVVVAAAVETEYILWWHVLVVGDKEWKGWLQQRSLPPLQAPPNPRPPWSHLPAHRCTPPRANWRACLMPFCSWQIPGASRCCS